MTTTQLGPSPEREIRELGVADHQALQSLALSSSTGSDRFRVDRSPDYFALGHALGDTRFHGLIEHGELIGSLAVSEQLRFIAHKPQRVAYIHDVRVSPEHAGRGAFRAFVTELSRRHAGRFTWVFCSVLDENPHSLAIRKVGAGFGTERVLGRFVHVGLPVVRRRPRDDFKVSRIPANEAWSHYLRLADDLDMAPADQERFLASPGEHLMVSRRGQIIATANWLDQSRARRIVATRDRTLKEALLSRWLVTRGAAQLARRGETLPIAYLSHFATRSGNPEVARALAGFMAQTSPGRHSHVFLGVAPERAAAHRGLGIVRLASTCFAYGTTPPNFELAFRELSWI